MQNQAMQLDPILRAAPTSSEPAPRRPQFAVVVSTTRRLEQIARETYVCAVRRLREELRRLVGTMTPANVAELENARQLIERELAAATRDLLIRGGIPLVTVAELLQHAGWEPAPVLLQVGIEAERIRLLPDELLPLAFARCGLAGRVAEGARHAAAADRDDEDDENDELVREADVREPGRLRACVELWHLLGRQAAALCAV